MRRGGSTRLADKDDQMCARSITNVLIWFPFVNEFVSRREKGEVQCENWPLCYWQLWRQLVVRGKTPTFPGQHQAPVPLRSRQGNLPKMNSKRSVLLSRSTPIPTSFATTQVSRLC